VLAIIASSTKSIMPPTKYASIAFDTGEKSIDEDHAGRARIRGAERD